MKQLLTMLLLLSLTLCITSCSDTESPASHMEIEEKALTIIPGQGINDLSIGDLGNKVETVLGEGFKPIINVGGSGNATYNYYSDAAGIDVIFGQHGSGDIGINSLPIIRFDLFGDFAGMTDEGIGIGSSKADVLAAYGEPDLIEFTSNVYNIGMLIFYNNMDQISNISILKV